MKRAERILKPCLKQARELLPFLVSEACAAAICLGILYVYLLMRHVKVTTEDDGFAAVKCRYVRTESVLPLHTIVKAFQPVLRIGHIGSENVVPLIFQRHHPAFMVVYAVTVVGYTTIGIDRSQSVEYVERLMFCVYSSA